MPIRTLEQLSLAKKVRSHVTAHPNQHDQRVWCEVGECGTNACIAGWTAILSGAEPFFGDAEDEQIETATVIFPGGRLEDVSLYARKMLGLGEFESRELFLTRNTAADALEYFDELIAAGEAALSGVSR